MNRENQKLTLALSKGKNFGWGVCSNYLIKETPKFYKNVEVWDFERDGSKVKNIDGKVFHALADLSFDTICKIWGNKNYGYTFFENELPQTSVENAKKFEKIIGGSSWNKMKLLEKGINNADMLIQGIDPEIFYPIEYQKNDDLFVIFSGGKFELRKGQDLLLKAIKILQEKYDDIVLINAWYNMWPKTMELFANSPHIQFEGKGNNWTEVMNHIYEINGLNADKIITLELIDNTKLRNLYSQTDIGVFPNRCEGGTNLVLMEYMACGKPVIGTNATGHTDILTNDNAILLNNNKLLRLMNNDQIWAEWVEPSLDELIAQIEYAHEHRTKIKQIGKNAGEYLKNFTWQKSAENLVKLIS